MIAIGANAAPNVGGIEATLKTKVVVTKVSAIQRIDATDGVKLRTHPGEVRGDRVTVSGLPLLGTYSLRLESEAGVVQGWDATVPPSDYEEEQPLERESRNTILAKLSRGALSRYFDRMVVLDVQGNAQNAVVLVANLRTRPFVGGGYKAGEWTWRVERCLWEFPDEDTWVPNQDLPFYSLVRERLYKRDYDALRVTYARHLGGIRLTRGATRANLGIIVVPRPRAGIHAIQPDGKPIRPFMLKPVLDPRVTQDPDTSKDKEADRE